MLYCTEARKMASMRRLGIRIGGNRNGCLRSCNKTLLTVGIITIVLAYYSPLNQGEGIFEGTGNDIRISVQETEGATVADVSLRRVEDASAAQTASGTADGKARILQESSLKMDDSVAHTTQGDRQTDSEKSVNSNYKKEEDSVDNEMDGSTESGEGDAISLCGSYIMIWTTPGYMWQSYHTASVESILTVDPCANVYMYSNTLPPDFFSYYVQAGYNVSLNRYDLIDLTRGKPGEQWVASMQEEKNRGPHHGVHESDFLRCVLLYNQGGSYLDTDHLMLPSAALLKDLKNVIGAEGCFDDNPDCFTLRNNPRVQTVESVNGEEWDQDKRICAANGVLVNWEKHHPILLDTLTYFDTGYDKECWSCAGPRRMGVMIPRYPESVTLLPERAFYPVQYTEASEAIKEADLNRCRKIISTAYGLHVYGHSIGAEGSIKHNSVADCVIQTVRFHRNLTETLSEEERREKCLAVVRSALNIRVYGDLHKPEIQRLDWLTECVLLLDPAATGGIVTDAFRITMHSESSQCSNNPKDDRRTVAVSLIAYKRTKFLREVLEGLGDNDGIKELMLMNNNRESHLEAQDIADLYHDSVSDKSFVPCVRVFNSGPADNLLFLGRFIGCLSSDSELCYFQDDDWVVKDTAQLFHIARGEPHRIHSVTDGTMVNIANRWRWGDAYTKLNTQFSWLGTGAVVSRVMVYRFFLQLLASGIPEKDRAMADFFFTMWTNQPQDVFQGAIVELTREFAFSGAEGTDAWNQGQDYNAKMIDMSVTELQEILFTDKFIPVRSLFLPMTRANLTADGARGETVINTNLTFEETDIWKTPSLYAGALSSTDKYKAILRTDMTEYGIRRHADVFTWWQNLWDHTNESSLKWGDRFNLRKLLFFGGESKVFEAAMYKECHFIIVDLLEPLATSRVCLGFKDVPERATIKVGDSLSTLAEVGRLTKVSEDRTDLCAERGDLPDTISAVVFEICRDETADNPVQKLDLYGIELSTGPAVDG